MQTKNDKWVMYATGSSADCRVWHQQEGRTCDSNWPLLEYRFSQERLAKPEPDPDCRLGRVDISLHYPWAGSDRALNQASVFLITQNNDCISSYKMCISLHPPCFLSRCMVTREWVDLMLKTWLVAHVTSLPETQEESKNIYFFNKENDKNNYNAQWIE